MLAQFFYVGAQVGTWSYFIQYVQDYTDQPEKVAGYFLTGTLVAFGVGRFSATYLMKFIQPRKLMGIYAIVNVALVAVGVLHPGWVGLWAIFLTSFFMSLMFPTIFALAIKELGPNTKMGGSMMVMAIIGGAVFTPMMGLVFDRTRSMALAMLVPLVCYVFIAYYAFVGSKVRLPRPETSQPDHGLVDLALGEAPAAGDALNGLHARHAVLLSVSRTASRSGVSSAVPASGLPTTKVISPLMDGRAWSVCLNSAGAASQEFLVQFGDLPRQHHGAGTQDGFDVLQGCQDAVRRLVEDQRGVLVLQTLKRLAALRRLGRQEAGEVEMRRWACRRPSARPPGRRGRARPRRGCRARRP